MRWQYNSKPSAIRHHPPINSVSIHSWKHKIKVGSIRAPLFCVAWKTNRMFRFTIKTRLEKRNHEKNEKRQVFYCSALISLIIRIFLRGFKWGKKEGIKSINNALHISSEHHKSITHRRNDVEFFTIFAIAGKVHMLGHTDEFTLKFINRFSLQMIPSSKKHKNNFPSHSNKRNWLEWKFSFPRPMSIVRGATAPNEASKYEKRSFYALHIRIDRHYSNSIVLSFPVCLSSSSALVKFHPNSH